MMKKLFTIIICICAVTAQAQKPNNEALRKLQMAEFAITNLYVDKVDEDKLVEEAIIKMLAQLDPHSTYNNAEEVKKMNEPLQGNFEGIGVQFQMIEDTLLVIQPVSNGPSEKVGILAGDRIVAVNDSAIAGVKMSTEDIMSRLRGPKDSEVKLTIVRRGVDDQLYFTVKRDKIPILSLDASYMIQPKTGYIRINRFGATTAEEFAEALKSLQKKGKIYFCCGKCTYGTDTDLRDDAGEQLASGIRHRGSRGFRECGSRQGTDSSDGGALYYQPRKKGRQQCGSRHL